MKSIRRLALPCLAVLLSAPELAPQAVRRAGPPVALRTAWFVDDDMPAGLGSGTCADPFGLIQDGIEAARHGDVVLVAPGQYPERLDFLGKEIAVVATGGPVQTSIDPGTSPLPVVGADFQNGEGPGSILQGFRFQTDDYRTIECSGASPTITGCVFTRCLGAIRCWNGSQARIVGNVFERSVVAAQIEVDRCEPLICNNVFRDNRANSNGGALFVDRSTLEIRDNLFVGNRAPSLGFSGRGGAIWANASTLVLDGNTFAENTAAGAGGLGGAVYANHSVLTLLGNIFWQNTAATGNHVSAPQSTVLVDYCDVEGGQGGIATSGALVWGVGNLDTDPLFVDPVNDDYGLSASSPLIDQGPPLAGAAALDLDGDPRVLDGDGNGVQRVDIGADEYNLVSLAATGVASPGQTLDFTTGGPTGWTYLLFQGWAFALTPRPPFGSLLLAPAGALAVGGGRVPGADAVLLPPTPAIVGLELWFQALVTEPGGAAGSYSNVLSFFVN